MKIWRLVDPFDHHYAEASLRGTWVLMAAEERCPLCGLSNYARVSPLQMEWEPGAAVVGDFIWPQFNLCIVVQAHVLEVLRTLTPRLSAGAVEIVDSFNAQTSNKGSRKLKAPFPYTRPPLVELIVPSHVNADLDRSSLRLLNDCNKCGRRQYDLIGVERVQSSWNREERRLERARVPRLPNHGLFYDEGSLVEPLFISFELPGCILCTDEAKRFIEAHKFTNIAFWEYGETK